MGGVGTDETATDKDSGFSTESTYVLVVEDGITQALHMRKMLEGAGFEVQVRNTGEEALQAIAARAPDLVLLDAHLPDIDGIEVARRLKKDPLSSGIPIVLVTAVFREVEDLIEGLNQGADDYLIKPVREGELVARVNACLRAKRVNVQLIRLARQLMTVNRVGKQLPAILSRKELLASFVKTLHVELGYLQADILLPVGKELLLAASADADPGTRWTLEDESKLAVRSYKRRQQLTQTLTKLGHATGGPSSGSLSVAVPFGGEGGEGGVLEVTTAQRRIDDNELLVLQTLGDLLAVALNNCRIHEELEGLATTDELTGLLNRRTILQRMDEELNRAVRYQRPLAVMLLDVDHFKRVNDEHGHALGDEVLRALGNTLRGALRKHDFAGRLGGDEFLMVLPETSLAACVQVAERIRVVCNQLSFEPSPGVSLQLSVSVGMATWPESGNIDSKSLLNSADMALYRSKGLGRNRVSQ